MSEHATPAWKEMPFGGLCARIVNGGTPATDNARFWGGHIPWVTGADFTSKGIGEIRRYVTYAGIRSSATSVVKAGNLLVVTRTGVGKLAIAHFDVAISQDITGVYLDETQVDTRFAFHLLSREIEELKKLNQGTSINGIVRSDLERHRVSFPANASQQRQIAAVLSRVDSAIDATEALIEKDRQIKAGLMRDLFTRGTLPNGELRPKPVESPGHYRDTPIGKVPTGWDVAGLASRQRSGVKWIRTEPFGSSLKGEHWVTEGHPVITIGALGEGEFLSSELLYVGPRDALRLRDFQLCEGDVVFSRVADVGRSVVVRSENAGWIMSSNLMRIAVDSSRVRPDYLQMALASDSRVKSQIRAKVNSGGREVANSEVLSQLLFVWPPPDEQDRIVELGLLAGSRIRSFQSTVQKLRAQKLGLMQDLLTGRVSVSPAAAETELSHG